MTNPTAAALIERSNRLGSDPKNTNYAGGNTSAKGSATDPVTGTISRPTTPYLVDIDLQIPTTTATIAGFSPSKIPDTHAVSPHRA